MSSSSTSMFVVVAAALCILAPQAATAFKEQDFKKCATSSFCDRHRNRPDGATSSVYKVEGTFTHKGAEAVALLSKAGEDTPLSLKLTCYADGVVRVHVDDPNKPRFAVQDVLVDDLDKKKTRFTSVKPDGPDRTLLVTSNPDVVVAVEHFPLKIVVSVSGVETMVFNARGKDPGRSRPHSNHSCFGVYSPRSRSSRLKSLEAL